MCLSKRCLGESHAKSNKTGERATDDQKHWDYDDDAILHIDKEGGLTPGTHVIRLQQSILAQYGYMPWDEEWVKNPPVPGSGAGAGKTDVISEFELELQDLEVLKWP